MNILGEYGGLNMNKIISVIVLVFSVFTLFGCKNAYNRFDDEALLIDIEDTQFVFYSSDYWIKNGNLQKIDDLLKQAIKLKGYLNTSGNRITSYARFEDNMVFVYTFIDKKERHFNIIGTLDLLTGSVSLDYIFEKDASLSIIVFIDDQTVGLHYKEEIHIFQFKLKQSIKKIPLSESIKSIQVMNTYNLIATLEENKLTLYRIENGIYTEQLIILPSHLMQLSHIEPGYFFSNSKYYHMDTFEIDDTMNHKDYRHYIRLQSEIYTIDPFDYRKDENVILRTHDGSQEIIYKTISIDSMLNLEHPVLTKLKVLADTYKLTLHITGYYTVNNKLIINIGDYGYSFFLVSRNTLNYAFVYDIETDEITYIGVTLNNLDVYETA